MEKDAAVLQKKIQSEVDQFKALQKGKYKRYECDIHWLANWILTVEVGTKYL